MNERIRDLLLGVLLLGAAFFSVYVLHRVLVAPSVPAVEQGVLWDAQKGFGDGARTQHGTRELFVPVTEVVPTPEVQEPAPSPYFISGLGLHAACSQKQIQCVAYIFGVVDFTINAMSCEKLMVADKPTMVETVSSLSRLISSMDEAELEKTNAAQLVAMAFTTTPAYNMCKAGLKGSI